MSRRKSATVGSAVSLSALDLFANAFGALAFLLLLFAATTIQLVKQAPLTILTKRLPVSAVGSDYIAVISAQGGVLPYKWTVHSGSLPLGLELHPERGEIQGTPANINASRTFQFEALLEDAKKHSARAQFELRVLGPKKSQDQQQTEPVVLLTHGRLPEALAGRPYELYLAARGGSGKYRWSAQGLPPGFSVAPLTGLLSGAPVSQGRYNLNLCVEDQIEGHGDAGVAMTTALLEVLAKGESQAIDRIQPSQVLILSENLPAAIQFEPYEVMLAGVGTQPLRWSAKGLPAGLTLSEEGVIRGAPRIAAEVRFLVQMSDAKQSKAADKTLVLKVKPKPLSSWERIKGRGLWSWLGYALLFLVNLAVLFVIRQYGWRETQKLLKQLDVNLIHKADGTSALNGSPEAVDAFQKSYGPMQHRYANYRRISYAVLGVGLIVYTIYILS